MSPKEKSRILCIFGTYIMSNRGTPLRIKNLVDQFSQNKEFEVFTRSRDMSLPFITNHSRYEVSFFKNLFQILALIKKNNINVVMGHTINSFKLLFFIKIFSKAQIVLEMHGFIEEESKLAGSISTFRYHINKIVYRLFYRMCDCITTCSETATLTLKSYNRNVYTVYGGVDTDLFQPLPSTQHEHVVLGYVGSARAWQGLDFLIQTFVAQKLYERGFRLKLLVSAGFELPALPALPASIEVLNEVAPEEVPAVLAQCDVLTIPRDSNEVNRLSFPSKLMEYMAMGIPVLASRTSDMHKIITHELNGLLFEPSNSNSFSINLMKLKDSIYRKKLGNNARNLVVQEYSWKKQAGLMMSIVNNLLLK